MIEHRKFHDELKEKYNLPINVIDKVVSSQFDFLRTIISEGKYESVRLMFLGLFSVKKGRVERIKNQRATNSEKGRLNRIKYENRQEE